ncbi:MAG: archaetidylserine decarboxylase [Polyangiales bacterium]
MSVASLVAAKSLGVLPRKRLSRMVGQLARIAAPDPVLRMAMRAYCRAYDVDLSSCEVPARGFQTFDEFFTRRLKPGARVLDRDPDAILSPADGRVEDLGPIAPGALLRIKGRDYDVAELLGDPAAGAELEGGHFAVIYLSPRDYHRVHAPVTGSVVALRHVPGTLFPVNRIGMAHVPRLLARNERIAVHQRSERHGQVISVMVGAIGVGRISVSFDDSAVTNAGREPGLRVYGDDPPVLERGEELGVFHMGSTVVLLVGPGDPLTLLPDAGDTTRMGQALARKRQR